MNTKLEIVCKRVEEAQQGGDADALMLLYVREDARWLAERVKELAKVARHAMQTASPSTCQMAEAALAELEG